MIHVGVCVYLHAHIYINTCIYIFCLYFLRHGLCLIIQVSLELMLPLPLPPVCCVYRCALACCF